MAARFASAYVKDSAGFGFEGLCSIVTSLGLTLLHPQRGEAFMLDETGEQMPIGPDVLRARIERGEDTTFEFWYADDHDLICRSRRAYDVRVVAFDLAGTDYAERTVLRDHLLQNFCTNKVLGATLGLVFDGEGVTAEYDWDALFVHRKCLTPEDLEAGLPEVLVIAEELAGNVHGFPQRSIRERMVSIT